MKTVVFVSDFFVDEILGGAELCNDALINEFLSKKFNLIKIKSSSITKEFLNANRDNYFLIANFFTLSEDNKQFIISNINYSIIEHDHKYLKNNNPAVFKNFLSSENNLQNIEFYKKAKYVLCQSTLHSEIVFKNTLINNIVNLKGNVWSEEHLNHLEKTIGSIKNDGYYILNSQNRNKGMLESINLCNDNGLSYNFIQQTDFYSFINSLAKVDKLVFTPTWIETFSRFAVEAKILGCKIITNNLLGCASDGYLSLSGLELLEKVRNRQKEIFSLYEDIINDRNVETFNIELPKVTMFATFISGEKYLETYLKSVTEQSIFKDIELVLLDCGSEGKEKEIIDRFKHNNIHYYRVDEKLKTSKAFNRMIELSENEYVCLNCIDDYPLPRYAETLRKHLFFSDVDLVYGDSAQSPIEIKDGDISNLRNKYEHSLMEFSKENMIKCLPGPMPMFKKKMAIDNQGFSEDLNYANDWDLWLRSVRNGSIFKKVDAITGIYYMNPAGNSTTKEESIKKTRQTEEKKVFFEYKDVFGEEVFQRYRPYFESL